jgi:Predicted nucleic acid-binding protein, contains PIN domain
MKIVIADASCLITLDNINETDLLPKLYDEIYVTPEVADEVGKSLPGWVLQRSSLNRSLIDRLTIELEIGESTSIALALDIPDCILIIDEKKGRRTAKELGIQITGTFGVVMKAIDAGLIEAPNTIAERLERAGFRISDALKETMLSKIH